MTSRFQPNNHERPTENSHRDGSSAGHRRGNVKGFAEHAFKVVANSQMMTQSLGIVASNQIASVVLDCAILGMEDGELMTVFRGARMGKRLIE